VVIFTLRPLYPLGETLRYTVDRRLIRGPFDKFVDWQQCAAVMQREAVTINAKL
jgi:hypothetical protein